MARIGVPAHHGGPATLNDPVSEYHRTCVSDSCAMWRWAVAEVPPAGAEPGRLVSGVLTRLDVGYCGIAGRPEVA